MFHDTRQLTQRSYVSGLVGLAVLYLGGLVSGLLGFDKIGWHFFVFKVADPGMATDFMMLPIVGAAMLAAELWLRYQVESSAMLRRHPLIEKGDYRRFALEVAYHAIGILFWLGLAGVIYHFGYKPAKYQGWHYLFERLWLIIVIAVVPYLAVTRAWQHDENLDESEASTLFWNLAKFLTRRRGARLGQNDWQIFLGMCVKFFFIPLMTIFFLDHIGHLRQNWRYLFTGFNPFAADYNLSRGTTDLFNIVFTFIMLGDVTLAWCGYTLSTRWVRNGLKSVEPTVIGWVVTLMCYPPYNGWWSKFIHVPAERGFLSMKPDWVVLLLAILALSSYALYLAATVVFGLRFSNLTNRGIIRTGPYRFVRHPAYAAKNVSWWLVMFPFVIYDAINGASARPLVGLIGLVFMSSLYYVRAITEERHLRRDPDYVEYCAQVKYRFIPGLF